MSAISLIPSQLISIGGSIADVCQTNFVQTSATCIRLFLGAKGVFDLYYECSDLSLIPTSFKELKQNWKEIAIKIIRMVGSLSYVISALTTTPALKIWELAGLKVLPPEIVATLLGISIVIDIFSWIIGGPAMVQTCYEVCKGIQNFYNKLTLPEPDKKMVALFGTEERGFSLPTLNFPTPISVIGLTILGSKILV